LAAFWVSGYLPDPSKHTHDAHKHIHTPSRPMLRHRIRPPRVNPLFAFLGRGGITNFAQTHAHIMRKHSLDTRVVAHALRPRPRYVYQPDKLEHWTPPAARFAFFGGGRHHELMHTSRANTYSTSPARARAPFTSPKSWKTGRPLCCTFRLFFWRRLFPWGGPLCRCCVEMYFPTPSLPLHLWPGDGTVVPSLKKKRSNAQCRVVSQCMVYANRR